MKQINTEILNQKINIGSSKNDEHADKTVKQFIVWLFDNVSLSEYPFNHSNLKKMNRIESAFNTNSDKIDDADFDFLKGYLDAVGVRPRVLATQLYDAINVIINE